MHQIVNIIQRYINTFNIFNFVCCNDILKEGARNMISERQSIPEKSQYVATTIVNGKIAFCNNEKVVEWFLYRVERIKNI